MSLHENLNHVLQEIENACNQSKRDRKEVQLIVISKHRTYEEIQRLYELGCRDFGESRVHEALEKMLKMPSDIRWHFVGKLQTNKVNKILGKFSLIHSVDTLHLAEKLSKQSLEKKIETSVLLEVNTSGEISKSGLSKEEWKKKFSSVLSLKGICIKGLMTMAPMTEDEEMIRQTFLKLRAFQQELEAEFGCDLNILSMGMSQDFPIAIACGATILRIGSRVFSE